MIVTRKQDWGKHDLETRETRWEADGVFSEGSLCLVQLGRAEIGGSAWRTSPGWSRCLPRCMLGEKVGIRFVLTVEMQCFVSVSQTLGFTLSETFPVHTGDFPVPRELGRRFGC